MRHLASKPLAWMIAAELVVVAALVFAALDMVMGTRAAAASPPAVLPATVSGGLPSPLPALPNANHASIRGPAPGLNVSPVFWKARLVQLNQDQVVLEQIEWRLVHEAMQWVQRYLELTVLPSIRHAERAGGEAVA